VSSDHWALRTRAAQWTRQTGAAALEFALVAPILFALVFGMIDYGLWFNDSLNTRQGVREGARQGVVQNYDTYSLSACPTAAKSVSASPSAMGKLACIVESRIGAVGGDTYVKIIVPSTWKRTAPLTVCAMVENDGLTGLVPLPRDGVIKSTTTMSIETETSPVPTGGIVTGTPAAANWSWCS
jgi:Flp pilus assembly protein TadG